MRKDKKAKIPPAGQRRDMTRRDNNASVTLDENLKEEINWRKEHKQ